MNPSSFYLTKIMGILFSLLFMLTTAQAASFDCEKAVSKIEKLICSDDELSKLDESLNKAYLQALERADIKQQIIESQREWLKYERNLCPSAECMRKAYTTRIKELNLTSSTGIVIHRDVRLYGSPPEALAKESKAAEIQFGAPV